MNLRQFVLALAAVFLALAGGVVLGARVLTDPMVTGLRGDKGGLQQRVEALTDEAAVLNNRLAASDEFDTAMSARIVGDALAGTPTSIVSSTTRFAPMESIACPRRTNKPSKS